MTIVKIPELHVVQQARSSKKLIMRRERDQSTIFDRGGAAKKLRPFVSQIDPFEWRGEASNISCARANSWPLFPFYVGGGRFHVARYGRSMLNSHIEISK